MIPAEETKTDLIRQLIYILYIRQYQSKSVPVNIEVFTLFTDSTLSMLESSVQRVCSVVFLYGVVLW